MLDDFKPGSRIQCTVTSEPRTHKARSTVARLMRRDRQIQRALRRGQRIRRQTTPTKIRGGRTWYIRPKPGKVSHPRQGESWTMILTPDIVPDLRSVEHHLEIKSAD